MNKKSFQECHSWQVSTETSVSDPISSNSDPSSSLLNNNGGIPQICCHASIDDPSSLREKRRRLLFSQQLYGRTRENESVASNNDAGQSCSISLTNENNSVSTSTLSPTNESILLFQSSSVPQESCTGGSLLRSFNSSDEATMFLPLSSSANDENTTELLDNIDGTKEGVLVDDLNNYNSSTFDSSSAAYTQSQSTLSNLYESNSIDSVESCNGGEPSSQKITLSDNLRNDFTQKDGLDGSSPPKKRSYRSAFLRSGSTVSVSSVANVFMKSSSLISSLSNIHPPDQYFAAEDTSSSQPLETDDVLAIKSAKPIKLKGSTKARPDDDLNLSCPSTSSKDCTLSGAPKRFRKPSKKVNFSRLRVFYFHRQQGCDTVPSVGSVALGMEPRHYLCKDYSFFEFHKANVRENTQKFLTWRTARSSSASKSSTKSTTTLSMEARTTMSLDETEKQNLSDMSCLGTDGREEPSDWSALTLNNNNNVDYCGEEPSTSLSISNRSVNVECESQPKVVDENDCDSSSVSSEESIGDELSQMECFLRPINGKIRKTILKEAGVDIDRSVRAEHKSIVNSRSICGCSCEDGQCAPETCDCAIFGINCQVDRPSFPCSCLVETCQNPSGRIEYEPMKVRLHYMHTLNRIKAAQKMGLDLNVNDTISPQRIVFNENAADENILSDNRCDALIGPQLLEMASVASTSFVSSSDCQSLPALLLRSESYSTVTTQYKPLVSQISLSGSSSTRTCLKVDGSSTPPPRRFEPTIRRRGNVRPVKDMPTKSDENEDGTLLRSTEFVDQTTLEIVIEKESDRSASAAERGGDMKKRDNTENRLMESSIVDSIAKADQEEQKRQVPSPTSPFFPKYPSLLGPFPWYCASRWQQSV